MAQRNKVHIDQESYVLLQLEATLQGESLKATLSRLVKAGVSKKTLAALQAAQSTHENKVPKGTIEQSTQKNIEVPKGTIEQSPNGAKNPLDTLPPSSGLLSADDEKVLQLLKEGVTVRTEIAKKLGISKSKAQEHVKLLKSLGLFYEKPNKRGTKGKL